MFIVSLGIAEDVTSNTAIYFPNGVSGHRVSFPSAFSLRKCSVDTYSIQERLPAKGTPHVAMSDARFLEHVIDGLVSRGYHRGARLHHLSQRAAQDLLLCGLRSGTMPKTRHHPEWFPPGLHLAGGFGFVEYANVDGILIRNLELASQLNGAPVSVNGGSVIK